MKVKIYYPIITTITFFLICNLTFAQWTQLADIPTARCFTSSCELDGKIYVIGGTESTSSTGPSVGTMEVYDPISDSWDTTKAPMPTSRVEFGACAVNGKIYAIGGATNHGASPFGRVEEFDPSTDLWYTNKTPMPTPRKGAAYGVIDNKIYVAGGTEVANYTASNKLEIYDPATDTWVDTLDTMDYAIYSPRGAVINDKFYVIGGLLGYAPWTGQKIVQMYDPITNEWSRVADLDSGRVGHTTNGIDGNIYAIGGDRQPPIVRSVEEYDPNPDTWTKIDSAPFVKTSHTASVFENKIYLISGSTTSLMGGFTPTSTVYSFYPSYLDTLHVPGEYSTIQAAIDSANNGNVVLVAEDTYYENINFKGKAITVASHFIIDSNETHIENTIIDGSQPSNPDSGSVVFFISGEDTNSVLCGFTITGGTGTIVVPNLARGGGGVLCNLSGATICHNRITNNVVNYDFESVGGGITSGPPGSDAMIIVKNNLIQSNQTIGANFEPHASFGAGLALTSHCRVTGNIIRDNVSFSELNQAWGGGFASLQSDYVLFTNNEVVGNKALNNSTDDLAAGGGIYFLRDSTAYIRVINNIIAQNEVKSEYLAKAAGMGFERTGNYGGDVLFANNIVYGNFCTGSGESRGGGISLRKSTVKIFNNTITTNSSDYGGGLSSNDSESSVVMNSIFWGNISNSEVYIRGTTPAPEIVYSDIQGGWTGEGNIDTNPSFSDTLFHLADWSLCIGEGKDSIDIAGTWYYCAVFDIEGNPRPNPPGSMPDIGACESPRENPLGVEEELSQIPEEYSLAQNYPNPFNPTTTIVYGIIKRTNVELKLFDVLGREVETIVNREQDADYYEMEFNASRLASGIYFYRLQAGDFIETKKMVLLK